MPAGAACKKLNFNGRIMDGRTSNPVFVHLIFLSAAPTGISGCSQQERLSLPVQSPCLLV
ncbi:MAG: hypothetical protein MPL62_05595 [Alphaproteobacteria bacterium]|nr:hypothetical protein [Alphaproteobacteria bacterium]